MTPAAVFPCRRERARVLPFLPALLPSLVLASLFPFPTARAVAPTATPAAAASKRPDAGDPRDKAAKGAPTDAQLNDVVRRRLEVDFGPAAAASVGVTTKGGTVRLEGNMPSIPEKERALAIAWNVRGVRQVDDALTVVPPARKDPELESAVRSALVSTLEVAPKSLHVTAHDGALTIEGTVPTAQDVRRAESVVKRVRGVRSIDNALVVVPVAQRSDADILRDVERSLRASSLIGFDSVSARVKDGRVTLTGTVISQAERAHVLDLVQVAGVRSVEAKGLVVGRPEKTSKVTSQSAQDVKENVLRTLRSDPRLTGPEPSVTVSGEGVVTLSGNVASVGEKRNMVEAAGHAAGVSAVDDELKVAGPGAPTGNDELARRVTDYLKLSPYFENQTKGAVNHVDVTVGTPGVVTLTGRTRSVFERNYAEYLAGLVPGVVEVRNDLSAPGFNAKKTDAELASDVREEFAWSPVLERGDIQVTAKEGKVTLAGAVDSPLEKRTATQLAFDAGARTVNNRLVVGEGASLSR